jgi:hypothetical protein
VWTDDFLYIAARVYDPFVWGSVTGHNNGTGAPYVNNDFEVFIDPSGTNRYYKEFEMNCQNATYDVMWGVPDYTQFGYNCEDTTGASKGNRSKPYVPVCISTTSGAYNGSKWSLGNGLTGTSTGLHTATSYSPAQFGHFRNGSYWTLEIAFPIHNSSAKGLAKGPVKGVPQVYSVWCMVYGV